MTDTTKKPAAKTTKKATKVKGTKGIQLVGKDGKLLPLTYEEFAKTLNELSRAAGFAAIPETMFTESIYNVYNVAREGINAGKVSAAAVVTSALMPGIDGLVSSIIDLVLRYYSQVKSQTVKNLLESYVIANAHGQTELAEALLIESKGLVLYTAPTLPPEPPTDEEIRATGGTPPTEKSDEPQLEVNEESFMRREKGVVPSAEPEVQEL